MHGLSPGEQAELQKSIPDLINDTPKSELAVLLWKRALARAKGLPGKVIDSLMTKACTDQVVEMFK